VVDSLQKCNGKLGCGTAEVKYDLLCLSLLTLDDLHRGCFGKLSVPDSVALQMN
jgi:hypothetical protein